MTFAVAFATTPLTIVTTSIPSGTAGMLFSSTLKATGSTQPYRWNLSSGSLPSGLSLTGSGVIAGTPKTAGSYSFTVGVSDNFGNQESQTYSMEVIAKATYYVSGPNGNDSWSGLLPSPNSSKTDGPFQTLTRAQSAMRSSSSFKAATLRAGTYSIASTLAFDWADNGEAWSSYSGETPVLDGNGTGDITVTGVNTLSFEGLIFQNMGAGGIVFLGTTAATIRWNLFNNCDTNCISGSALTNSVIDSNTINGQSSGESAIQLWYGSSNNQITHNLLENCHGGGINFATGVTDPPANNNVVDRNMLINVNISSSDQGALYMGDRSHSAVGNEITNNVIHGNGGGSLTSFTKAIYLDDLMSNTLVSGNVCSTCGQYALQVHGGDHNTIVNNIFDLSSGAQLVFYQVSLVADDGMAANTIDKNIIYFSGAAPASLYQVQIYSDDTLPIDSGNLYYSATGANVPNGQTIIDAGPLYVNPEFAQPAVGNYSMPSSSPAFTSLGFQPVATNQGPMPGGPAGSGSSGLLTGYGNSSTSTANLTAEGPTDWAHWGTTSLTRRNGTTPQIGAWSIVGSGEAIYYADDLRALTFTNGTVPVTGTVTDGIYINGQNGFSFTAPAGTSAHTLTVHVGGYFSSGTLTAHLSDGSAADFVDTTSVVNGQYDRNYTLNYRAASAGQTLIIKWVCNSVTGNVTLNGAALQ